MSTRTPRADGLATAPNAAADANNPASELVELQVHRSWGRWASDKQLPNGSANAASAPAYDLMRPGDVAWAQDTGLLYVLADRGTLAGGDAAWVSQAGNGPIQLVTPISRTLFGSIVAALAAASSGDVVELWPGTYFESVTIPAGVQLSGVAGSNTPTIDGALATGTRVTLSDGSTLFNVNIGLPTDAVPAVTYAGAAQATVKEVGFTGAGALGVGFRNSGAGTTFLDRVSYLSGTCDVFVDVTGGVVQANEVFVFSGTMTDVVKVVGGLFDFNNVSIARGVVSVDGLEVGAGATVHGHSVILYDSVTNALHITSNTADVELGDADLAGGTADILADAGVVSARVHISGAQLSTDRIDVPGALRSSGSWLLSYTDTKGSDEAQRIEAELSVGAAEKPSELSVGEGDSYTEGMVVITTDGTAGPVSDGGNLTDVSVAAASDTGSTFTFQGVAAGHTILFGSSRSNGSVLKHWGLKISQTTAAVEVTPRSFVIEIWDGISWVDVGKMATHSTLFHRYGNELFIRGSDSEHLRFGLDPDTVWATKTISGADLYWTRIRIATTVTTAPVFQQSKLHPSHFEANGDGTNTYFGTSRFRKTLLNAGNVFGESGGVTNFNLTVGSGGVPTGWQHQIKNSGLNGNADAIYLQFKLPRDIDTSFPLRFSVDYVPITTGGADVDLIMSVQALEVQGVLEADPAGGIAPVARTLANTETLTAHPGTAITQTIDSATGTKMQSVAFGPYPVEDYYEGDSILVRLELDDDGTGNADIGVVGVEVAGVAWTNGERLRSDEAVPAFSPNDISSFVAGYTTNMSPGAGALTDWHDDSGNAYDLDNVVGNPQVTGGVDGRAAPAFDGVLDEVGGAAGATLANTIGAGAVGDFEVWSVTDITAAPGGGGSVYFDVPTLFTGEDGWMALGLDDTVPITIFGYNDGINGDISLTVAGNIADGNAHVVRSRLDSNVAYLRVDAGAEASVGGFTTHRAFLDSILTATDYSRLYNITGSYHVWVFDQPLSDDDRDLMYSWIKYNYPNVTVP